MTSVLSILFLKGPFLTFFDNSGSALKLSIAGLIRITENGSHELSGNTLIIYIPGLIVPAISLVIIFLFKNRKLQLAATRILMLIILTFLAVSIIYTFIILSGFNAEIESWYKLLIPVLQLIFSYLAFRGIKKDDDLVKSYDRLR
jgi:glucan phosphoethanolaminetransferase (alkaline phosphatase superfamily)